MKVLILPSTINPQFARCILVFGILTVVAHQLLQAQNNDLRMWNNLGLNVPLTDKADLRFSYLRSYKLEEGIKNNFNSFSVRFAYDVTKDWDVRTAFVWRSSPNSEEVRRRLFLQGTHRTRLADVFSWRNGARLEWNSSNENNYRYRVHLFTRIGPRKRLKFLKLSPSVSYTLFYNIGGNPIQYYDEEGDRTVKQAPNGFHRGRVNFRLNSRVTRHLRLTVNYMIQREFNFLVGEYREINVVNPRNGKVRRRFRNYEVIGFSVSYILGGGPDRNQPFFEML